METPKPKSKRNLILAVAGGLLVLCMICGIIGNLGGDKDKSTPTPAALAQVENTKPAATDVPAATDTPAPTSIPTATLTPMESLKAAIVQKLGKCNREVERVSGVDVGAGQEIQVTFAINDNLFESSIAWSAKRDVADILQMVSQSDLDYALVRIDGTFSMKDQYGNVSEDVVVRVTYSKATVGKINWDGFDPENIYNIADTQLVHRLFR